MDVQTGMRFPHTASSGNCVPFRAQIPGHSFPKALVSETASRSAAKKWDALSAEHTVDTLPCQVCLERKQSRLRITPANLIDTLKLIRLATK